MPGPSRGPLRAGYRPGRDEARRCRGPGALPGCRGDGRGRWATGRGRGPTYQRLDDAADRCRASTARARGTRHRRLRYGPEGLKWPGRRETPGTGAGPPLALRHRQGRRRRCRGSPAPPVPSAVRGGPATRTSPEPTRNRRNAGPQSRRSDPSRGTARSSPDRMPRTLEPSAFRSPADVRSFTPPLSRIIPPTASRVELAIRGGFILSGRRSHQKEGVHNPTKKPRQGPGFAMREAPGGFEPPMEVLQTSALPLGYGAWFKNRVGHGISHGRTSQPRSGRFRARTGAARRPSPDEEGLRAAWESEDGLGFS